MRGATGVDRKQPATYQRLTKEGNSDISIHAPVRGVTARHCAVCDPIGSFVIDFDNGTSLFARKT